jgi:hypothetical protein
MVARWLALMVVVLVGCAAPRLVSTPDGYRPQGAAYRLTPTEGGAAMPPSWTLTSHERRGAELVKKSSEKSDLRARRADGGELVLDTWMLPESMTDADAREVADRLFQALCSEHSERVTMTPFFGLGIRSQSTFYGSHTLATKDLTVGQLSAFMFVFVRNGFGPRPELTFMIVAYHQRHSRNAYTVTLAAPPTEFENALPDAVDFTRRLHLDGADEMPELPTTQPPKNEAPVHVDSPYTTLRATSATTIVGMQ